MNNSEYGDRFGPSFELRRERAERWISDDLSRTECNCRHPVPGPKYLGRTACAICRRLYPVEDE